MLATRHRRAPRALLVLATLAVLVGGCDRRDPARASAAGGDGDGGGVPVIRVAYQFGLGYAPIELLGDGGAAGGDRDVRIELVQLPNGAAIREAMLAGRVDIGVMGIAPYLVGRAAGTEWTVAFGVAQAPIALVVRASALIGGERSAGAVERGFDALPLRARLEAVEPTARIAVPQPGSIQHAVLGAMLDAAELPTDRFDGGLVALPHPDALAALVAGRVDGYLAVPPYLAIARGTEGLVEVARDAEALPDGFSFLVAVAAPHLTDSELIDRLERRVAESAARLSRRDPAAVTAVAGRWAIDSDDLARQLDEMRFSTSVVGIDQIAATMRRTGILTGE